MSSNDTTENFSFESAIEKLSGLGEGAQIELINELFDKQEVTQNAQFLYVIIYEVSYLLERYEQEEVIRKLVDDGMYRSVILILIDRLQQLPPDEQVDARVLESIPDDEFLNLIEMSNKHEFTGKTIDELASEYEMERGTLNSSFRFLRNIVARNLQGNLAMNEMHSHLISLGISHTKIEIIKENMEKNLENLRKIMVFNAVMDGTSSLNQIHHRLDRVDEGMAKIWQAIKDLTDSLSGNSVPNTSNPGIR